jgi:hypothetical protein
MAVQANQTQDSVQGSIPSRVIALNRVPLRKRLNQNGTVRSLGDPSPNATLILRAVSSALLPRRNSYLKITRIFAISIFLIHPYHSRFIPEGVAKASRIFLRDAHVLPKLFSYE